MSDDTKKPEQSTTSEKPEPIADLPEKSLTDSDAQSVKGGAAQKGVITKF